MDDKNNIIDRILQNRVLTHVLFWLFAWLVAPYTSDDSITEIAEALLFRGVGLPTKMAATYLLAYYQIPRLLQRKKYILFTLSFMLSTMVFCIIYRFNNIYIAEAIAGSTYPKESLWQIITEIQYTYFDYFFRVYFYSILFIFIKMIKDRNREKRELESLKQGKTQAELDFLKAQIHPHFLFNTLNNLYALTLDKSDKAPDVVARLSEILDYMLYQCKGDKVLLTKEIELLEHYIDLEKLRYGNRLELSFHHSVRDKQLLIAPLILVSMVENAFKHGVSGAVQRALINILLEEKEGDLIFTVYNTRPQEEQKDDMKYKEGIGMKNVNRQLELIYPDRHTLKVEEEEESYEVKLTISL